MRKLPDARSGGGAGARRSRRHGLGRRDDDHARPAGGGGSRETEGRQDVRRQRQEAGARAGEEEGHQAKPPSRRSTWMRVEAALERREGGRPAAPPAAVCDPAAGASPGGQRLRNWRRAGLGGWSSEPGRGLQRAQGTGSASAGSPSGRALRQKGVKACAHDADCPRCVR